MKPHRLLPHALACALLACAVLRADETPTLTTCAEVRALSAGDAAKGRPVRLSGVVTFATLTPPLLFLQDDTGAVVAIGPQDKQLRVDYKIGSLVEIEGVTSGVPSGLTGRKNEPLHLSVAGEDSLPPPRQVSAAQLNDPALQSLRVELPGVVRAVHTEPYGSSGMEMLVLTLAADSERLIAVVPAWKSDIQPETLVGASVRVQGVFNAASIEKQPQFTHRLLLTGFKDIIVDQPGRAPFDPPIDPIAAARDAGPGDRMHVRGTVTLAAPGRGMFVENEGGGIWIETETPATTGARVDVAGFPVLRDGAPRLEDAIWRGGERSVQIEPAVISARQALSGRHDGRLVQIEALLLTTSFTGDGPALVLQSGERVFLARVVNPATRLRPLREDSWLRITGVCVNDRAPELQRSSFHLVFSGPDAIVVSSAPRWWTLRRIIGVVAALAVVAAAGLAWAVTLRRRVARQTGEIREHLAREAVAQERVRIARELHDSLQQDLLGITMQLKATDRLLDDPAKARAALQLASAMVRRGQAETHRAIWDLRDTGDAQPNLVATLRELIAGLRTEGGVIVEVTGTGHVRSLPPSVESQTLRVAQEALTNALKHGHATRIELELDYAIDRLTLLVRDDGRGFDSDHPPAAASGQFGLFGMRERAAKLGADLRITSRPGAGTAVHLSVPLVVEPLENHPTQIASALRLSPRTASL